MQKSTIVACDTRLAPYLQHQIGGLKSDVLDNAFKPERGIRTWRRAKEKTYLPELSRHLAIAMTNAAAARHVAGAVLMYGAPTMSDEAVNKLADGFAEAHKITGATGLLQTCVGSYLESVAFVDRHEDISLDEADYQGCPADTPIAGGSQRRSCQRSRGDSSTRFVSDRRSKLRSARQPTSSPGSRSRSLRLSPLSRGFAASCSRMLTSPTSATTTSSPSWRYRRAATRPTRR